jgi:drug/metabolite transporter (DMT)-like permease
MNLGLLAAFLATALWGFAFFIPILLEEFTSFEVALGRFVFYGVASTFLALIKLKGRIDHLPWRFWRLSVIFTLSSLVVYYILLVKSLQILGGSFGTALASLLPVSSSIYGNYRYKTYPWKVLFIPVFAIFLGLFLMQFEAFTTLEHLSPSFFWGCLTSFGAISLWSWYTVRNGEFLREHPSIDGTDWVALMGLFSFLGGISLFCLMYCFFPDELYLLKASHEEIKTYFVGSLVNGLFVSCLTNVFWNFASRRLPMAFLAQLAVLEIFFGLFYVYCYQQALPTGFEFLGLAFIFSGLSFSFTRLREAVKPLGE